ncbi:CRISPR-associated ring nuclease Csm6 [Acinetobacter sichuanensis]|uniref:CRISPR-associated ring nuclease Csm6 n=1 Tax=Acinetobacter sichuanensis TaxID=2136183 RepID=UPI00280CE1F6|nr:CRISPR-associated ring nuclease Csm6 [Acinetobacter sichuanensis]MDQ9021832.1 CRISPR-associated ring nuclease Csm6 [Acinetobacter sichuanensis]
MSKNILLLVTGMSPAIVTETIYGLAVNPAEGQEKWIPDEVHIISTEHGLNQIRARLIDQGHFQQLLDDYNLPQIKFGEEYFYPIRDIDGKPQLDLRTPADNERAANLICEKVRFFTSDKNEDGSEKSDDEKVTSLHVSIAGGRKTMGFYIGYALSLYGRANDHMSHVLVEAAFDETKVADFYYPTPFQHQVKDYAGTSWNAQDATIWLSYIPFVRLRASLPEKSLIKQATFSEVVASINLANEPIKIRIESKSKKVYVGHKFVKLPPREFSFYQWFAEQKLDDPEAVVQAIVEGENRPIPRLFELWKGNDNLDPTDPKSGTFDHAYFEQRLTMIKRKFTEEFTENVAKLIMIQHKNGKGSGYILPLDQQQIEIIKH